MSPMPRKTWSKILIPNLYRRIFADQGTQMIALKKIKTDVRNWDWYDDAF